MQYIPQNESKVLKSALIGTHFIHSEVLRVMCHYGSKINLTQGNLKDLIVKAAKAELISKPFVAFSIFKEAFSVFFDSIGKCAVNALYQSASPTVNNVMDYIVFDEAIDIQEQNTFHWMESYLRDMSPDMLVYFLRFTTGSNMILPGNRIYCGSTFQNNAGFGGKANFTNLH